jgi:predicted nuclease of predicted toxin-antitoxin system
LEVIHALDIGLGGCSDQMIFDWAQANSAIVVTFDEDFADLRAFPLQHFGVIRLRVWPTTIEETRDALERLFAQASDADLRGALTIVDQTKIRIRRA